MFTVAFLGLSPLVRDFTKTMAPVMAYIATNGILSFIYLDNLIVFGSSKEVCAKNLAFVRNIWEKCGWIENTRKATPPTQKGEYLGFTIDTVEMKFFIPSAKAIKISDKTSPSPSVPPGSWQACTATPSAV